MTQDDDHAELRYPFWVSRVGAIFWIAEGFVQLLSPWRPVWSLRFYSWWLGKEAERA